ncbi:hypothetical protein AARAC_009277 [Aspergillus arachidicola]|uniref:Uncharacterized protein n=1 Tax=Aspergillus arachidicola TaxID=656916 RepID=A0A2G7FU11_9EURO|nr:hypothetical protein AARAC_009277 [Aspergillus arachidicola]
MEPYDPAYDVETQEPVPEPKWRVRPQTWEEDNGPAIHINEFRNELKELIRYSDKKPRPTKVQLFEHWLTVDLTTRDLLCLFFDIPALAPKRLIENFGHLVHPLNEVPEGKQRICFMFKAFSSNQPEVLDNELEKIFTGVKKVLDEQGEEGRTKTLPIVWEKRYVFTVEKKMEDIKPGINRLAISELNLLRAQIFQIEELGYLVDWTNLLFLVIEMLFFEGDEFAVASCYLQWNESIF